MEYNWLGKKEEIEFAKIKFAGKLGGKALKYADHIEKIIVIRMVIFAMPILMFFPVLIDYLFDDFFSPDLFIERLIFSLIFIIAGLVYNKYRIVSIVIAIIPLTLILLMNLINIEEADMDTMAVYTAFLLFILSGIYYHIQAKKLKKELEQSLLENQLIDD